MRIMVIRIDVIMLGVHEVYLSILISVASLVNKNLLKDLGKTRGRFNINMPSCQ